MILFSPSLKISKQENVLLRTQIYVISKNMDDNKAQKSSFLGRIRWWRSSTQELYWFW